MTADEAFVKFLHSRADHDLPWMIKAEDMRPIFMAGWSAHDEASKLVVLTDFELDRHNLSPAGLPAVTPEAIYAAYPRKVGKLAAIKAIKKAMKEVASNTGDSHTRLLGATIQFALATQQWPAADKQFIPHPATWFNRGSYDDDPATWQRGAAATPSQYSKTYQ